MTAEYGLKDKLKIRNARTVTAAGDVLMGNEGVLVLKKTVGGATQVTLTPSPSPGDVVVVKDGKGDAASNNITVIGAAAATIDGAANYVISENYGAALFEWNGTEWGCVCSFKENVSQGSGTYTTMNATTANVTNAVVTSDTVTTSTITTANVTTLNVAGLTTLSDVVTVNAAGSVIANAAALSHAVNVVAGANDVKGVILPAPSAGSLLMIYSSQATNGLLVYPPVNGTINNGSANSSINIEGKTLALFLGTSATNWASIFTINA